MKREKSLRRLAVGDRVFIVGRDHPWRGHAGTIVEEFMPELGLEWAVEVVTSGIGAPCAGCSERDLRRVEGDDP